MTQIKPFKGIHYNAEKVGDFSKVVCPPYDVISKEEQVRLHHLHPNNFIHVLLGLERENDNERDNKYIRSQKTFEDWLSKGVMVEDNKPCLYFCKQEYVIRGQKYSRMGFIALMKLQNKGESKIFPHENIHSAAKEDRLRLWQSTKANCSPIFVCFADRDKTVQRIFAEQFSAKKPWMSVVDSDGTSHKMWRLDEERLIIEIQKSLTDQQLFIADGHHRYETAMEYRNLVKTVKGKLSDTDSCNYVMTYFTNLDSKDLLILPIHRLVKKFRGRLDFLEDFFRIDKIRVKDDLPILLARAGQNEHAFGLYSSEGMTLLRLKNKLLIDQYITEGSKDFKSLDATILKWFVFDKVGVKSEDITYTKDIQDVIEKVDSGQVEAGFILNPIRIQQLKAIALNGERMPPKTTYFYPKVLSGLTLYRLN